jgi:hypothetical protein
MSETPHVDASTLRHRVMISTQYKGEILMGFLKCISGTTERILDWGAKLRVSAGLVFVSPKLDPSGLQCWVPLIKIIGFFKLTFVYVIF